jgi:1,2-diacylglycerol 3-beta-galactosyltransferase
VGVVLPNFEEVDRSVAQLIEPATLARYRANSAALNNRAVFEIPDILEEIFTKTSGMIQADTAQPLADKLA